MDFFKLLQSLDDLLYEVMAWLVFYPVTLWRAIRHPQRMMRYADAELVDDVGEQYSDTLSPPLFLLISLIISHAIELLAIGQSTLVTRTAGLDRLIDSDSTLIVLRVLVFSLFPLGMATRLVQRQKIGLNRKTLRPPFYSQCYVAAPFALVVGIAAILLKLEPTSLRVAGLVLMLAALLGYGALQARWFALHLGESHWRGFIDASIAMIGCIAILCLAASLFA